MAYAKLLREAETGEMPLVNYRKPTFIASDNRIAVAPAPVVVKASLILRWLFQQLAEAKDGRPPTS